MKSPFPNMDPYLEADMWIDIHHTLASHIREMIVPFIVPKYIAKVEPQTIIDQSSTEDIGIMYPDVALLDSSRKKTFQEPVEIYETSVTISPPSLELIDPQAFEVRIPTIKIYDRQNRELVTAIELLSPVNKREPQLTSYRKKRLAFREANVHLLEIDLIRRGTSPFVNPRLPKSDYRIILTRAERQFAKNWTFNVEDSIPVLPVPLRKPDPDIHLDLGKAIHHIYERNYYHLSIDYQKAPPPPIFEEKRLKWVEKQIEQWTNGEV